MAVRDGLLPNKQIGPFEHLRLKRSPPDRQKLSDDELRAIESLELERGSVIWHSQQVFMFSFYAGGMRFSDVATLRREHLFEDDDAWRVRYRMKKDPGRATATLGATGG